MGLVTTSLSVRRRKKKNSAVVGDYAEKQKKGIKKAPWF